MKLFPAYIMILLASMLFSGIALKAQSAIPIASNDHVTTTIFFPSHIAKVIPPAANFNFEYEVNTRIGLLKGRKGRPSNLLVITDDGYAYSFALSFSEEVQTFNFILTTDQAVSQTDPNKTIPSTSVANRKGDDSNIPDKVEDTTAAVAIDSNNTATTDQIPEVSSDNADTPTEKVRLNTATVDTLIQQNKDVPQQSSDTKVEGTEDDDLYDSDREEYYRIFCENNYLQKPAILRVFRQSKKILVQLNNILVDRNEKYFIFQIENNSRKEFSVEGISFFKKSGVGQLEKIMTPLYIFNLQEKIDPDSINEVVLVFKNFNISSKEEIMVVLADAEYDKMVKLPMKNIIVNFPSN